MIKQEHKDLWKRIEEFSIDDLHAEVRFSDKLARENNWSKEYTQRVISEYKKFIFLCCVLPNGASPSDVVDQAWHIHLTYTINYWKEFCQKTLGKEIHHHPSKGGIAEKKKHTGWYADTLSQYKYYFDTAAPADIWPPLQDNEISSSRESGGQISGIKYFLYFLPAFFVPLFYGKLHIYVLTGPQFLIFFGILLAGLALALTKRYQHKKKILEDIISQYDTSQSNIFQVTRFVHGQIRSLQTAIVDLAYRGLLVPGNKKHFLVNTDTYVENIAEANPLLPGLVRNYHHGEAITVSQLEKICDTYKTYDLNLYNLYHEVRKRDQLSIALLIFPLLIAVLRFLQGISNERPVAYLFMLSLACLAIGLMIIWRISYPVMLQRYFKNKYEQKGWVTHDGNTAIPAIGFAFLGIVAISGMGGGENIQNTFRDYKWNNSSSTSGCGSSGCGSGCGSGCSGGGGCGGCGGGD